MLIKYAKSMEVSDRKISQGINTKEKKGRGKIHLKIERYEEMKFADDSA
jgi:hypothetical protein